MPKKLVTRQDWIECALYRFAEGGESALNIEQMAKQLKCSKSSFYHYFSNRTSFMEEMMEHWQKISTAEVASHIQQQSDSPEAQIRQLVQIAFTTKAGKDFIFHLRHLAHKNSIYADLLEQTENQRIQFMAQVLQSAGKSAEEAIALSELFYFYYLGWYEKHKFEETSAEQATILTNRLFKLLHLFQDKQDD